MDKSIKELFYDMDKNNETFYNVIDKSQDNRCNRCIEYTRQKTALEILSFVGDLDDGDGFKLKDYFWFQRLCEQYNVEID